MKMSPEYVKAQENMQPGEITADGFLGDDERPIVEIIQDDESEMNRLGVSFDDAVSRMRYLLREGQKGLEEPVTVDDRWIVRVSEARGFLPSPFEDGIFRKINTEVEHAPGGEATGGQLWYTELSLHLMEKYHFLQGKGSPFRIEPQKIKEVLEL